MTFVVIIGYIVYAGVANKIDNLVWYAIGLVVLEGIILVMNKGSCPLTPWAARFTDAREDNFDIFLPQWLARHNKSIFSTIFAFGVALVIYRLVKEGT
jgi:hypothetical protein